MSNMLDTTSSSEGMRAFKPGITHLVRLFCFPHNNPFASLVPGTATLQLQWQRLPWFCGTAGMLSCCNGKNGGVQTPSQPHPSQGCLSWLGACVHQMKHQAQTCTALSTLKEEQLHGCPAAEDIQNRTGVSTNHNRNQKSILCPLFFFFSEEGKEIVSSLLNQPERHESPVALPAQQAHL